MSFDSAEDVAKVWVLRAAGLVMALTSKDRGDVRVLAITPEGREALQRMREPEETRPETLAVQGWTSRLRAAAHNVSSSDRARQPASSIAIAIAKLR